MKFLRVAVTASYLAILLAAVDYIARSTELLPYSWADNIQLLGADVYDSLIAIMSSKAMKWGGLVFAVVGGIAFALWLIASIQTRDWDDAQAVGYWLFAAPLGIVAKDVQMLVNYLLNGIRVVGIILCSPYILLCEFSSFLRHRPTEVDRKQMADLRPEKGDPFPDYPLPTFEDFWVACRKTIRPSPSDWLYWVTPRKRATHRQQRAKRRTLLVLYYKECSDGKQPVPPVEHEILPWGVELWPDEFARALTPQMIDYFLSRFLNDSVSPAAFEQSYRVLDEIIYRYTVHTLSRGLYTRWANEYPIIADTFRLDDFRTFLSRHLLVTRSSATLLQEHRQLIHLLLSVARVHREPEKLSDAEKQLEERQREAEKLRHEADQAERDRRHEAEQAERDRQSKEKIARDNLETERLAEKRYRLDRLRERDEMIKEINSRVHWPQHLKDEQVRLTHLQYREFDDNSRQADPDESDTES